MEVDLEKALELIRSYAKHVKYMEGLTFLDEWQQDDESGLNKEDFKLLREITGEKD